MTVIHSKRSAAALPASRVCSPELSCALCRLGDTFWPRSSIHVGNRPMRGMSCESSPSCPTRLPSNLIQAEVTRWSCCSVWRSSRRKRQGGRTPALQKVRLPAGTSPGLGIELGERLYHSGGAELPHSPGLAGALVCRSRLKEVGGRAGVGAGDHAPTGAVPLFDEGLRDVAGGVEECSHGPDVGGGDDGHPPEIIGPPRARTGDDAPAGAVP